MKFLFFLDLFEHVSVCVCVSGSVNDELLKLDENVNNLIPGILKNIMVKFLIYWG